MNQSPKLRDIVYDYLIVNPIISQRAPIGRRQPLSDRHYIIWSVKLQHSSYPDLPENLVIDNRRIFKEDIEFKILVYDDRAVLTCADTLFVSTFLYADPSFPDNLLDFVDSVVFQVLSGTR